jgi:hypothetical protein
MSESYTPIFTRMQVKRLLGVSDSRDMGPES